MRTLLRCNNRKIGLDQQWTTEKWILLADRREYSRNIKCIVCINVCVYMYTYCTI